MSATICAVPVCDRPKTKRSWCEAHYTRWRKTGDAGNEPVRPQRTHNYRRGICAVEGCGREEHCKTYCASHYIKLRKTGTAGTATLKPQRKAIDHEDDTRTCNTCSERKPLSDYYEAKNCIKGHRATCISCSNARDTRRRSTVPHVYAATSATRRARKRSTEVDPGLTHQALRERDGDHCYYCHQVMSFAASTLGQWNPLKASIEHLLPLSRGGSHTFDNTVLACLRCNVRKHNKTVDEWEKQKAWRPTGQQQLNGVECETKSEPKQESAV